MLTSGHPTRLLTRVADPLTSVNVLLFFSSAWHLGRKLKADYF